MSEAANVFKLTINSSFNYHITDITGIVSFVNLKIVDLRNTDATTLDFSGMPQLEELNIEDHLNQTNLFINGCVNLKKLQFLDCPLLSTFDLAASGSQSSLETLFLSGAGISSLEVVGLTIFPNPASNDLNIQKKTDFEISTINIYNIVGQLVIAIPNAQQVSKVDVSSLTNGNYFIKINSDKGTTNAKFAKN